MPDSESKMRHILHLSDIHLKTVEQAQIYGNRLKLDLRDSLKLDKIDYLVISGDLTNTAVPAEYEAVAKFFASLKEDFPVALEKTIIAPGNHDVNWDRATESYKYVAKHKLPTTLGDEYVRLTEGDALLRDEELYRKRFDNFSALYKEICGQTYPTAYEDQAIVQAFPEDRILFLVLNSAWQIDQRFTERAAINMLALGKALNKITPAKFDGWLKAAVWHHPVTGREGMSSEFLEQLAVKGFELAMHGHIHEAIEGYHKYDDRRGLHFVGGGTFGAPAKEQVTGIPLQYNLLAFDPETGVMKVRSRKKEKVDGAWSADSRWGDKESPVPYYTIALTKYRPLKPSPPPNAGDAPDKPSEMPAQSPDPQTYFDITGTRWKADWHYEDGRTYVSDEVTFEKLTGNNQFVGYGEVVHHGKQYKYSIRGEVSRTGIVVFIYKAERFPTEANIGTACLQLSIGAEDLEGAWSGFAYAKQPDGTGLPKVVSGKLVMKKLDTGQP